MRCIKIPPLALHDFCRDVMSKGGRLSFDCSVWGTSMSPFISHGDTIVVESMKAGEIEVGNVMVFVGDRGKLVAHRLMGRRNEDGEIRLVARSDVAGARDEIVIDGDVFGKVVRVVRGSLMQRLIGLATAKLNNSAAVWAPSLRQILTGPSQS